MTCYILIHFDIWPSLERDHLDHERLTELQFSSLYSCSSPQLRFSTWRNRDLEVHHRENGLPDAVSRGALKRARLDHLDLSTPYGPLFDTIEVELLDGKKARYPAVAPVAFLHGVLKRCSGFRSYFESALRATPATLQEPWRISLYVDEVLPGNALKVTNERKLVAFYLLVFPGAWPTGAFRSIVVSRPVCQEFKREAHQGWSEPDHVQNIGALLQTWRRSPVRNPVWNSGKCTQRVLWSLLTKLRSKQSLASRGQVEPCRASGVPMSLRTIAILISMTHLALWCPLAWWPCQVASNILMRASGKNANLLANEHGTRNRKQFGELEQSVGLTFDPLGMLWSNQFSDVGVMDVACFDWMHCYVVSGIFHTEVGYMMEALPDQITNSMVHDFSSAISWPHSSKSRGTTGYKASDKRSISSGELKCSASEALSLYPALRAFISEKVDHTAPAYLSFIALCSVLDVLQLSRKSEIDPGKLLSLVEAHLGHRLVAYGPKSFQPKVHFSLHLSRQLEKHGLLVACWVHERKHKELKRFANNMHQATSSTSWENGLLEDVVLT